MEKFEGLLESYVKSTYIKQGLQNEKSRSNQQKILLTHKKLPVDGWDDSSIEFFIRELSIMDSNNFSSNAGVGEREGRVYSSLVQRRHFDLAHGIGRSGDIAEVQPKAAGSSVIYKLATALTVHATQIAGISATTNCLIMPMATGMTLTMCMMTLKKTASNAKYVIWPRIDQKSCFKSILTAGLTPLIVENLMKDEELLTDVNAIKNLLTTYGDEILCVLSTTSCFAPRQPDSIDEIASLCKEYNVGHVINNAYGLQCPIIVRLINRACTVGRVDAVVQSTDKNFMVPVGGAIVLSPSPEFIGSLSSTYPGRASIAPILDLFITLLSMGEKGYRGLLEERKVLLDKMKTGLNAINEKYRLGYLKSPKNTISIGISIESLSTEGSGSSFLGSMLFQRSVSGCRVVAKSPVPKKVAGFDFISWGAHKNGYPYGYFTVACAIGMTNTDVTEFLNRLDKCLKKFAVSSITKEIKESEVKKENEKEV